MGQTDLFGAVGGGEEPGVERGPSKASRAQRARNDQNEVRGLISTLEWSRTWQPSSRRPSPRFTPAAGSDAGPWDGPSLSVAFGPSAD